jgi:TonB family protein
MFRFLVLALILAGVSPSVAAEKPAATPDKPAPLLAAAPAASEAAAPTAAEPAGSRIAGSYVSGSGRRAVIRIAPLGEGAIQVRSEEGWTSVGYFSGSRYEGVLREVREARGGSRGSDGLGTLRFELLADRTIEADVWPAGTEARRWRESWTPTNVPGAGVVPAPSSTPAGSPALSYERPPMPKSWSKPDYPSAAKSKKIEGTVVVDVLVGVDGKVKATRIANSIPELDAAAEKAARKWRFEPALADGKPVEAWAPVPVRFSLK